VSGYSGSPVFVQQAVLVQIASARTRPELWRQAGAYLRRLSKSHAVELGDALINLSTSLAGQAVGIKEVDDGIWLVTFMDYDLGYIDLEEKTLQPLGITTFQFRLAND
jgi:hypothetical protein